MTFPVACPGDREELASRCYGGFGDDPLVFAGQRLQGPGLERAGLTAAQCW
jgi:hypothetical protein